MVRIKGLVGVFNRVRTQLQAGLQPAEVEPFRQQVRAVVADVEEICRRHKTKPEQLPGPSRLAYLFLKELNLDNLPVNQTEEPAAAKPSFKIRNVVKIGDQLAERIWQTLGALLASPAARAELVQDMGSHAASIERLCLQHGQTPSAMEAPSRQVYCWLKFLCVEENLASHLDALEYARQATSEQGLRSGQSIHVHLICLNAIWRTRQYRNAVLLRVNEGFQKADESVWRAVLGNALSPRNQANDRLVQEFALSDDFSEALFELESFAAVTTQPRGREHDLDESFARVNAAYFEGQISKPALVWNRTLTASKFGHYQPSRDTLMISVSLDDARVPAFVIDFVMYHELLHKKHGVMIVNGRRLSHSLVFREDERRFAEYAGAENMLKELALRQRGWDLAKTARLDG